MRQRLTEFVALTPKAKEAHTRTISMVLIGWALFASTVAAQTAEEIVAKYIKAVGGMEKINAVTSLRKTGKYVGGGGFEIPIVTEQKRPNKIRQEFIFQGLTGVTAYDGKEGWKIQPWEGKKEAEGLDEEEMKQVIEDSDFDGPLVNFAEKGNSIEYVGMDQVEGSDAYKLKVTLRSGDIQYYYMDTDYFVPIKIDVNRMVRGAPREYEIILGDYKEVAGWYLPFSSETNVKGSQDKAKNEFDTIEANVSLDDNRFAKPVLPAKSR